MARSRKKIGWSAKEVIELLECEQGQVRWSQRYDPVSELVFTVLSQHTSDLNAERAFKGLRATFGSWEVVARGDVGVIEECIRVGGLARVKAPRIKQLLNKIVELRGELNLDFLKDLPLDEAKAWLRELPGIGPKSSAVVLCFSLGMPAMPVDTHVYRVSKRLGLIGNKTNAEDAHEFLEKMVAPEEVYPFHVLLITHGRRVCKAQRPLCHQCVLAERCPSRYLFEAGGERGTSRGK
jgi:endonuclease-3